MSASECYACCERDAFVRRLAVPCEACIYMSPGQYGILAVDGEEAVDSRPMDSCIVVVTI